MTPQFKLIVNLIGAALVGGYGFIAFRYPEVFARMNVRFGFKRAMNPKFIKFTRWMGIAEMILAALSLVSTIAILAFGWK